jgi:hypothetical protein
MGQGALQRSIALASMFAVVVIRALRRCLYSLTRPRHASSAAAILKLQNSCGIRYAGRVNDAARLVDTRHQTTLYHEAPRPRPSSTIS